MHIQFIREAIFPPVQSLLRIYRKKQITVSVIHQVHSVTYACHNIDWASNYDFVALKVYKNIIPLHLKVHTEEHIHTYMHTYIQAVEAYGVEDVRDSILSR
jgi:hypothetical protein